MTKKTWAVGLKFKAMMLDTLEVQVLDILANCQRPKPKTLELQITKSRSYVHALGPEVGTIYVLGALGKGIAFAGAGVA